MKGNNLSRAKVLELANMFTAQVVSIYEFEKMSGIPSSVILRVFNKDLYEIDEKKAKEVNRILSIPGYINYRGYIKEYTKCV